jgi:hypothetical protein
MAARSRPLFGGLIGGVVGIVGVLTNLWLLHRGQAVTTTALTMVGVTVACLLLWFVVGVMVLAGQQ